MLLSETTVNGWCQDRASCLSGRSPSRKGDVYIPTFASLLTAPADPGLLVPGALSDPTVVLVWSDDFDSKNRDLYLLEQESCSEGVAESTWCNRTWSGCCGLGIPQFPEHTMDIDGTDLSHKFQKVKRHGVQTSHGHTRPNDQTFEAEFVRTAWYQRTVRQLLQADTTLVVHVVFPFLLQQKDIFRARQLQRWRLEFYALGWRRRILHVWPHPRSLVEWRRSV